MFGNENSKNTSNRLRGIETLETRMLMAADLGVAMLDTMHVPEHQEAAAYIALRDRALPMNEVSEAGADTTGFELVANGFSSAAEDAINSLFDDLPAEALDFILRHDLLGINDSIEIAAGLGAFNPPETGGAGGIDIPDFANPDGFGGSDTDEGPAASDPWSLLRPSADLGAHVGGIASTDPPKDTTSAVRSLSPNEHRSEDGSEHSWTDGSGSRVTVRDAAGGTHSASGLGIVAGTQITRVKPNGTVISFSAYDLEDGATFSGRVVVDSEGRGDAEFHTTPGRTAESADPDAEPTAVLLPHQAVPDFNPSSSLVSPDLFNPGQPEDSGPRATTIDPGDSIVVNPAGAATQAHAVSRELMEHWQNELRERAGGLVNPEG
jgi:hypothetical protein